MFYFFSLLRLLFFLSSLVIVYKVYRINFFILFCIILFEFNEAFFNKIVFFIITLIDINTKTETEETNKINEQNDMNFLIVFVLKIAFWLFSRRANTIFILSRWNSQTMKWLNVFAKREKPPEWCSFIYACQNEVFPHLCVSKCRFSQFRSFERIRFCLKHVIISILMLFHVDFSAGKFISSSGI